MATVIDTAPQVHQMLISPHVTGGQESAQVTVSPLADMRHFDSVQILTRPQAGLERAEAP